MRDENQKKSKLSWSKTLIRKWFNIKGKTEDFYADDVARGGGDFEWARTSFSEREACTLKKKRVVNNNNHPGRARHGMIHLDAQQVIDVQEFRCGMFHDSICHLWDNNSPHFPFCETEIDSPYLFNCLFGNSLRLFVATWNVGGKSPPSHLNLEDWLHTSPPADIYVIGFQEIVPLNAGNVLGAEDNGPAKKWLALIRKTLNNLPDTSGSSGYHTPSPATNPLVELDADFEGSSRNKTSSFFHRRSFQSFSRSLRMDNDIAVSQPWQDRRFSVCDRVIYSHRPSDYDSNFRSGGSSDDENGPFESPRTSGFFSPMSYSIAASMEERERSLSGSSRYCLLASKQMVGIFLTVWVRSDLRGGCKNLKVSCIGRGLMGYLGNKGSISISMSLRETSFCFVCTHLTSGQKEGDELRRNSDVMEILRKTRFPPVHGVGTEKSPETILQHDRVIWLGDLNYRIALSYRAAKAFVEMHNWRALLENDQLRIEQKHGRVFQGWKEGKIYFPPTYKYSNNSDRYTGDRIYPKEKRRTPAWCDRILWCGRGLKQLSYVRGESKFSDHRPVYSIFVAEVESLNQMGMEKNMNCSSSRVEVEELLPHSQGYTELRFF